MRIVLYVASLIASVFALRFIFQMLYFAGLTHLKVLTGIPSFLHVALFIVVVYLPFSLLGIRAFIWFKNRKVTVPDSFRGFPYLVSCIAATVLVLAVVAYAVLLFKGSGVGLSGVPLGMLLMLLGAILALVMPFVEIRDWHSFRRAGRQVGLQPGA